MHGFIQVTSSETHRPIVVAVDCINDVSIWHYPVVESSWQERREGSLISVARGSDHVDYKAKETVEEVVALLEAAQTEVKLDVGLKGDAADGAARTFLGDLTAKNLPNVGLRFTDPGWGKTMQLPSPPTVTHPPYAMCERLEPHPMDECPMRWSPPAGVVLDPVVAEWERVMADAGISQISLKGDRLRVWDTNHRKVLDRPRRDT